MVDARKVLPPKCEFHRTEDCIAIVRDSILFRYFPVLKKFQLDRLGEDPKADPDKDYRDIQAKSKVKKQVYGVFGYIQMKKCSYLILIEEASIVGEILRGSVLKVE